MFNWPDQSWSRKQRHQRSSWCSGSRSRRRWWGPAVLRWWSVSSQQSSNSGCNWRRQTSNIWTVCRGEADDVWVMERWWVLTRSPFRCRPTWWIPVLHSLSPSRRDRRWCAESTGGRWRFGSPWHTSNTKVQHWKKIITCDHLLCFFTQLYVAAVDASNVSSALWTSTRRRVDVWYDTFLLCLSLSPVDVRFLHHSFHSVVELKESHVLRGKRVSECSWMNICMKLKNFLKEMRKSRQTSDGVIQDV